MRREPSIHITKSVLSKIIWDLFPCDQAEGIVKEIMKRARPYSISTRSITVSNDRIDKVAKKIIESSRVDAALFARLIYAVRKGMKHRGISPIKPGSQDWAMVKQITGHALDFQLEYNITAKRKAFTIYIRIGLDLVKSFHLNKFANLYSPICQRYQAEEDIRNDTDKEMTDHLYKAYNDIVVKTTGIFEHYESMPEKYVWFVKAREQAESMNIRVDMYIKAQFEGLDFTRGIPHPSQLVGDKARDRVIRYLFKNNIKI